MSEGKVQELLIKRENKGWLEDTREELQRRVEALEEAQHDVNVRLEKVESSVEQSLASVHHCIDNLLLALANKKDGDVKEGQVTTAKIKKEQDTEAAAFPVPLAAQSGDLPATKALVLAGADACTQNERGESALQIAAAGGHSGIVEHLLRQYTDTEDGLSSARAQEQLEEALMCAANSSVAKLLIGKMGRCAITAALCRAACEGRLPVLRDLLRTGVDPNGVDANGWSALHWASERGHVECVKVLLETFAKAGYVGGPKMQTPLHIAAEKGHSDCLETLLLWAPSIINTRDQHGWSALHYAAFGMWPECVKVLLRHGINVALTNNHGQTALQQAACLSAVERDAKPEGPAVLARRKQVLKFLLNAGADPNMRDEDSKTALDQDGAAAVHQVMG